MSESGTLCAILPFIFSAGIVQVLPTISAQVIPHTSPGRRFESCRPDHLVVPKPITSIVVGFFF
jgi:hypothetical protein